jgi:crotonobetainyl-CoA:carnitine CoA-transferase CaiB-like acyl-CoA transferase
MAPVLDGLRVLDLSSGLAGSVTTMLMADYGAEVIKVEPPGGDRLRDYPGFVVWNRGKKSVVLDLARPDDAAAFHQLASTADVLVESFRPGTTERLGIGYDQLHLENPRLVYCSITGYGRHSVASSRPAYDGLVQARSGIQNEQAGHRPGPVYLYVPLPSYGAMFLASCAIHAALHAREVTGTGQWVETSLMQGAISFTSMLWFRAEHESPEVFAGGHGPFAFKHLPATPSFECADGKWMKTMGGHEMALAALGDDPASLHPERATRSVEDRAAYFADIRAIYRRRPRDFWVELFESNRISIFRAQSVEEGFEDEQVNHNGAVMEVEVPGVGVVKQFGHAWRLAANEPPPVGPPPGVGEHTAEVLGVPRAAATPPPKRIGQLRHPLEGIKVLDLGHPFAGSFGPMLLADLGADVLVVEPISHGAPLARGAVAAVPGLGLDNVWIGCQRGKRCLTLDMSTDEGKEALAKLIAGADVIHSNRGRGIARAFGFDYERAAAINPTIVYCHTTAYGETGPYAGWPGVDQLAECQCGLEWEQGAVPAGGEGPQWYRFGQCDHANAFQSAIAVLQALYHRDRTGQGQYVDTCILNSGMLYSSDAFVGPPGLAGRPHMTKDQTGLGALYRLYETQAGWLFVVASNDREWRALCRGLGADWLADDPRFATPAGRADHDHELAAVLEPLFKERTAAEWFDLLDRAGAPCEISEEGYGQGYGFFDDPDAAANGWVARYQHHSMGLIEQFGSLFSLSETPATISGPPPVRGEHSRQVLLELGYGDDDIEAFARQGITSWPGATA